MSDIAERKAHHIQLALEAGSQSISGDSFESIPLDYKALPEMNLAEVDTTTTLLGKKLSQPLIIASMTGGTKHARTINQNIAIAAAETGVAFGLGSQRIALELEDARESFAVARKLAPKSVILANMGAVQLNYGWGISDFQRVVDMIKADGLYLHLNPLQEAMQPEGDTDFSGLLDKIHELCSKISVPVFAKEVGHGISAEVAVNLLKAGVSGIDVAGTGGTSWAWIEAKRQPGKKAELFADWFSNFGLSAADSLSQVAEVIRKRGNNVNKPLLIASGGLRSPLSGLKAINLGADYYSAALPFLTAALESSEAVIELIQIWQQGLKTAMFVSGKKSIL